jgi:hypothetical protein
LESKKKKEKKIVETKNQKNGFQGRCVSSLTIGWNQADQKDLVKKNRPNSGPSTGPNPTTSVYNASVVNLYNATGSLARFENKNILFYFEKCSSLLQRWRCSCKFKNRKIGSWFCQ